MSIFSKNVLFSEVKGQVVLNGQAVSGAEVERYHNWDGSGAKGVEKIQTDQNGKFSFPIIKKYSAISKFFPHEPVIYQRILIRHNGQEHVAWLFTKHDYEINGELDGKPLNLYCELSKKEMDNDNFFGLCETR